MQPPTRVGGSNGSVGVRIGSVSLLAYQHVGIGNVKFSCWRYYPMRSPNATHRDVSRSKHFS